MLLLELLLVGRGLLLLILRVLAWHLALVMIRRASLELLGRLLSSLRRGLRH